MGNSLRRTMPGEAPQTRPKRVYHHSHPKHNLKLRKYKKPYACNGCMELGFGARYNCKQCNYDLHEECAFTTLTTSHEFFQAFTFTFFDKLRKYDHNNCDKCGRHCVACGKAINGFVYHCNAKDWDLHPCCRNLKKELCIEGVKFELSDKVSSKCDRCNQRKLQDTVSAGIRGWSYVSICKEIHFHVYCIREIVLESWKINNCLAIENLELPNEIINDSNGGGVIKNRNGEGGSKPGKIVKIFLMTIAGILLGDPTTFADLVKELM